LSRHDGLNMPQTTERFLSEQQLVRCDGTLGELKIALQLTLATMRPSRP
jgi:hypothetical protein